MARSKSKNAKAKLKRQNESQEQSTDEFSSIKVQHSPIYGRYLTASRDLNPGEKVLEEPALVVASSQDSPPVCIGCYTPLNFCRSTRCNQCGFPLCSSKCTGIGKQSGHNNWECNLLAQSAVQTTPESILQNSLDAIGPLRCLALREAAPHQWGIICSMETHTEKRRKVKSLWERNQRNVVDVIRLNWGLNQFDEELIHQMCGVLEVNSFEVGNGLRAIYPTAYLFAHNCVPNTRHCDNENYQITFRTTQAVLANEPLFVTYTYILQGTQKRREHLLQTKFFDCMCNRCTDPTECGTNISGLKCPNCHTGVLNCCHPLNSMSEWTCSKCQSQGNSVTGERVAKLTERIYAELDGIEGNDVNAYETFLKKYSAILDENHYLSLSALHCLYQLYGKIEGFLINDLTEEQLQRKVDICKQLLKTFSKLEPGYSKQRGLIQYELHAPLMVLMQRRHQDRRAGKVEVKDKLKEVIRCLEDAKKLLIDEPDGSEAKQTAMAANEALENLINWRTVVNGI